MWLEMSRIIISRYLKALMKKMGYNWADGLIHFSYGMVELPEGRMKSREGTVVDADDLIREMKETAKSVSLNWANCQIFLKKKKGRYSEKSALGLLNILF